MHCGKEYEGAYFSQSFGACSTKRSMTMSPALVSSKTDMLEVERGTRQNPRV